jgi:hypothetical protein
MWSWIKKNIKPLSGAIVLSLLLWFLVATDKEYSHQVKVPIEIIRLAPGKTLSEKIPNYAIIELRGKGRSLIGLWFYDVKFRLELPGIRTSQSINLKDYLNFLEIPSTFGLEVDEIIEPTVIKLVVDDQVLQQKTILLAGSIGTADGYVLVDFQFTPDTVLVDGPEKIVNNIDFINTQQLEISDSKSKFNRKVDLENPFPGLINIDPTTVDVEFDIQRLAERTVFEIPIKIINIPRRMSVEPIPPVLDLRIKGGEQLVAALQPEDIIAEIDFRKSYEPGRDFYTAKIKTPEKISWIESFPKTFNLKIKRN